MKMDLQARRLGACTSAIMSTALAFLLCVGLTGCGDQLNGTGQFEQASDSCSASVAAHRYVAKFLDGHTEVVHAETDAEFVEGFLTAHKPEIQFAEPDYVVQAKRGPTWVNRKVASTADNWGPVNVGADTLWRAGVRGEGVTVAVIDSGMDLNHPQLAGRLLPAGDHGFDFINSRPLTGDFAKHGTHVAGIIAAEHDDTVAGGGNHVEGVAPKANLLPLAFLDGDGLGLMSDAVRAVEYAAHRGARVINASWGGQQCSRALRESIRGLEKKNIFFVTAAGNAGYKRAANNIELVPEYPASLNLFAMLTVGAIDVFGATAEFSNFGPHAVHIFAPGQNIVSTLPNNQMGPLDGTSMATPFVAGAVALLLSAEKTASIAQVRQALYESASTEADYVNASHGRLNLRGTLAALRQIMAR